MNIVEGTLRRDGGTPYVEAHGMRWPVPASTGGTDGEAVSYGVRPEHMGIGGDGEPVQAQIIVVEPTGAETELVIGVGEQQLVLVTSGRPRVEPGQRIGLSIDPSMVHLFDRASGIRL
jgi:multiple sugar transport system ATP-binding protein